MVEDYIHINAMTPMKKFNIKLAKVAQGFIKKRKPFDEQCARLDFRDKIENAEKESERRHGFVKVSELKFDVEKIDFNKYAASDRFELLEDQEDVQDKVIEGSRTQVIIGHTLSYKCKPRGHGLSVFIPIAEYIKLNKKKE